MRVVLDEALVGARVAPAARLHQVGLRDRRRRIRRGQNIVRAVAVGAGRDADEPELGHLAVERAAERLHDLAVAGAALRGRPRDANLSVSARWMVCAVWQSVQTGAASLPFFSALPRARPGRNVRSTPCGTMPQVAGMFARKTRAVLSSVPRMSCVPWQSAHAGAAAVSPAFSFAHE